jgi:CIC family chloride channel protein
MLPLLIACFSAYALADLLREEPIYEALLERDLLRGRREPEPGETLLLDLRVEEGAPFAGRKLADLGLPPGCLLVTVQHGVHSEIPTRHTVLHAGDQIAVVIAPTAAGAVDLLRRGVRGAAPHEGL